MNKVKLCKVDNLPKKDPTHYQINGIVSDELTVSVLYSRYQHRGALMANGHIEGHNLICGGYRLRNHGQNCTFQGLRLCRHRFFNENKLSIINQEMHLLAGINYAGIH